MWTLLLSCLQVWLWLNCCVPGVLLKVVVPARINCLIMPATFFALCSWIASGRVLRIHLSIPSEHLLTCYTMTSVVLLFTTFYVMTCSTFVYIICSCVILQFCPLIDSQICSPLTLTCHFWVSHCILGCMACDATCEIILFGKDHFSVVGHNKCVICLSHT